MVTFNVEQTLLFNIGISIFSMLIIFLIYINYRANFTKAYDVSLLRRIQLHVILILFLDALSWLINGQSSPAMRSMHYTFSIIGFTLQFIVVGSWVRYTDYRMFGRYNPSTFEKIFVYVPLCLLTLLLITTPLTGLVFRVDDDGFYHRGALSGPIFIINLMYLIVISVVALIKASKETSGDRKSELLAIAFFSLPTVIGGVAQTLAYGISLVWPAVTISSLVVFLNKESRAILQDSLTGLNNQRNIERHFRAYDESGGHNVTIMMMDINDFKAINDLYGHSLGDLALIESANILRATFRGTNAFLARYAGDEFVVVLPHGNKKIIDEHVQKVKESFAQFKPTPALPFQLSVSIGYASSSKKTKNRLTMLFREADENMYKDKALYRQEHKGELTPP